MTDQSLFSVEERAILEARGRAAAATGTDAGVAPELEILVARSGQELYGLPEPDVRAVAALTRLSPLPGAPAHVAGLSVFRGGIVVVFYLHAILGGPPTLSEHGRMIVVDEDCALAVDSIERLEPVDHFRPAPEGLQRAAGLVTGVTPSGVAILDLKRLVRGNLLTVDIRESGVASSGAKP